jgi:hypothetical protein
MKHIAFFAAALMALATPALAQTKDGKEVSIPFANFGGIDDWRADGRQALYIKGRRNNDWYYAKLLSSCQGLPFAEAVGFKGNPPSTFDKFSTIIVDGQSCPLVSLIKSEKPPANK